jgi:hypothetical protein
MAVPRTTEITIDIDLADYLDLPKSMLDDGELAELADWIARARRALRRDPAEAEYCLERAWPIIERFCR